MSYGQNPYGQNPYGGQQEPAGPRPYGGQPQQPNPYGQAPQQNPYGPAPQQNPYGPAPQQNPYGQPQHSPYGQQPETHGRPGQPNPYAQPAGRPAEGQPQAEAWRAQQPSARTPTAAIAEHAVPVHTLDEDPESFIARSLGEVIGVALRPRTHDVAALTHARQEAVSRMAEMAEAAGADGVVGLRFDSNTEEIVAYGTAVMLTEEFELDELDLTDPAVAAFAALDDEIASPGEVVDAEIVDDNDEPAFDDDRAVSTPEGAQSHPEPPPSPYATNPYAQSPQQRDRDDPDGHRHPGRPFSNG